MAFQTATVKQHSRLRMLYLVADNSLGCEDGGRGEWRLAEGAAR